MFDIVPTREFPVMTQISFLGFTRRELRKRRYKKMRQEHDPNALKVHVFRDVWFVDDHDRTQHVRDGRMNLSLNGKKFVPAAQTHREWGRPLIKPHPIDPGQPHSVVDGPLHYLGINFAHYGHFLLETLSRLWPYAGTPVDDRQFLFHSGCEFDAIREPNRPMLGILGLNNENLLNLNGKGPVLIRELHVPDPTFVIRTAAHTFHKRVFDVIREGLGIPGGQTTKQPLYLSRAGYTAGRSAKRQVIGEDILEQYLEAAGCRIMRPENHSIIEQITAVEQHETLVGFIGSALHTVLFASGPRQVLGLCRQAPNEGYTLGDWVCGNKAVYLYAKDDRPWEGMALPQGVVLPNLPAIAEALVSMSPSISPPPIQPFQEAMHARLMALIESGNIVLEKQQPWITRMWRRWV